MWSPRCLEERDGAEPDVLLGNGPPGSKEEQCPMFFLGGLHGVFQWWGVCSWMLLAFPHRTKAFPSFYKETDEGQKPPCTCALQVSLSSLYSAGTAACQTCLVRGQLVVCGFWVRLGLASSTAGKAVLSPILAGLEVKLLLLHTGALLQKGIILIFSWAGIELHH